MSIDGMRVLVTRPAGQAEGLIAALEALGAEVSHVPLLSIEAIPPAEVANVEQSEQLRIRECIAKLDQYHKLVFISTNAVAEGFAWIKRYWSQLPLGPSCYAIGAATAAALQQHDCSVSYPLQAMNSEALLAMQDFQHINGQRVLIFRGVGGREHLAASMRERGAEVDYCEVYRRRALGIEAQKLHDLLQQPLVLSVTSVETLEALWQAAQQAGVERKILKQALLVPSVRVAQKAQSLNFTSIIQAENAGTAALCAALQNWRDNAADKGLGNS